MNPINWHKTSTQTCVYLIAVLHPEHGSLVKIGYGSPRRVKSVTKHLREAQFTIVDTYYGECEDVVSAETYLHELFATQRLSQTNLFGFPGGTEVFTTPLSEVLAVTQYPTRPVTLLIPPDLPVRGIPDTRFMHFTIPLADRITLEGLEAGEVWLDCRNWNIKPDKPNELPNKPSSYRIEVDWFTFTNQQPFRECGDPLKGSSEWNQIRNKVQSLENSITNFFWQYLLHSGNFEELMLSIRHTPKISVLQLIPILARSVRLSISNTAHRSLQHSTDEVALRTQAPLQG